MGLLWTAFVGLLTGALAGAIVRGRDGGGLIITMLLGLSGAVVGAAVGRILGLYEMGEGAGLVMAVLGAMIVLLVHNRLRGSGRRIRHAKGRPI